MRTRRLLLVVALAVAVVACGGSKVLKDTSPLEFKAPLASATDGRLTAALDWVIVRDGPGTWARNADWDEYLIRVRNVSDEPVRVISVHVYDSLGTGISVGNNRRQLVKGAKKAARRYREQGLEVKAGMGGAAMAATGAAVYSASAAVGVAALSTGSTAAAMGAVAGIAVVAPALALRGMVRGINNGRVDDQIKSRQTSLPLELRAREEANLDVFFSITPSPSHVEISYAAADGEHLLRIATRPMLAGLHLDGGEQAVSSPR